MAEIIQFPVSERIGLNNEQQYFADTVKEMASPIKMAIGTIANIGYGNYVAESQYEVEKGSMPFISADSVRFRIFHGYNEWEKKQAFHTRRKLDHRVFFAECFDGRQKTFNARLIDRSPKGGRSNMWGDSQSVEFLPEHAHWTQMLGRHFVPDSFYRSSLDTIISSIRATQNKQ